MKRNIIIILVSLHISLIYALPTNPDSTIVNLLPDSFFQELEKLDNPIIIDARDTRQFSKYKIKNAIHAPTKKVLYPTVDTLDKEVAIFVYCEVGFSSKLAAKALKKRGFKHIYNLEKGIKNWRKKGYPIEKLKKR